MWRARDACLFYGTFEGALKGLVIHVMATRHRSVDRSNACAAQKPRTTARNARRADTSAQGVPGSATPLRPSAWSSSATMPVHATAARAGWVQALG